MSNMRSFVEKELAARRLLFERKIAEIDEAMAVLATIKDDAGMSYRIEFYDGWPDEKSVRVNRRAPLEKVMEQATKKYKKLNNRSDVQARCSVQATVPPTSVAVLLPDEMWKKSFDKFGKYHPPVQS